MCHIAEIFRQGILLFLRKFPVSKNFADENGGIMFLRLKLLVSQCRKTSWASLQCFRKFGESKNFLHDRGYHIFPSKIFGLTEPKYFIGEHCAVSEKLFYWKFSCIGGGASRFCRIILSHRTETTIFVK